VNVLLRKLMGGPQPRAEFGVLMVCMGNICRSPTAEAVLRLKLQQLGLGQRVRVDSAGTHSYHIGSPPDERAQAHARKRGIEMAGLRARRVTPQDFESFDLLLAMDEDNLTELRDMAPPGAEGRAKLLMEFARTFRAYREVPDPYYGAAQGFEQVLDLVDDACDGLAGVLVRMLGPAEGPRS
jgi:protein-tyrosine phosphatase